MTFPPLETPAYAELNFLQYWLIDVAAFLVLANALVALLLIVLGRALIRLSSVKLLSLFSKTDFQNNSRSDKTVNGGILLNNVEK